MISQGRWAQIVNEFTKSIEKHMKIDSSHGADKAVAEIIKKYDLDIAGGVSPDGRSLILIYDPTGTSYYYLASFPQWSVTETKYVTYCFESKQLVTHELIKSMLV